VAVSTSGKDIIPHKIRNLVNAPLRSRTIVVPSENFSKHTDIFMAKCSVYYNVKAGGIHIESFLSSCRSRQLDHVERTL
jgi:hypothetical protein